MRTKVSHVLPWAGATILVAVVAMSAVWAGYTSRQLDGITQRMEALVANGADTLTTSVCWTLGGISHQTEVMTTRQGDESTATFVARHLDEIQATKDGITQAGGTVVSCG